MNDYTRKGLTEMCEAAGIYFDTYSPGGVPTRYKFMLKRADYFSGNGFYTAVGLKQAYVFAKGYLLGQVHEKHRNSA